jgi:hypothetical protein
MVMVFQLTISRSAIGKHQEEQTKNQGSGGLLSGWSPLGRPAGGIPLELKTWVLALPIMKSKSDCWLLMVFAVELYL